MTFPVTSRSIATSIFTFVLLLPFAPISANAQIPSITFGGSIPTTGSFLKSCNIISAGSTDNSDFNVRWKLSAQCETGKKDAQGKPILASPSLIGYQSCLNSGLDIQNVGGQLMCALPPGSWKDHCKNARITMDGGETPGGNVLVADCSLGGPSQTLKFSLVDQCTTDIKVRADQYNPSLLELWCGLPQGSYTQTCPSGVARDPWNIFNGASELYAVCKTKSGSLHNTGPLPYPYLCQPFTVGPLGGMDIANENGNLVCNQPPGASPPPQGCNPQCVGSGKPGAGAGVQGCSNPYASCP